MPGTETSGREVAEITQLIRKRAGEDHRSDQARDALIEIAEEIEARFGITH